MPEIVYLYAMVNRMRVLGMRKTTLCADVVMRSIIDTYFGPNRTVADLRELVRTGQGIDPLKTLAKRARGTACVRVALKGSAGSSPTRLFGLGRSARVRVLIHSSVSAPALNGVGVMQSAPQGLDKIKLYPALSLPIVAIVF